MPLAVPALLVLHVPFRGLADGVRAAPYPVWAKADRPASGDAFELVRDQLQPLERAWEPLEPQDDRAETCGGLGPRVDVGSRLPAVAEHLEQLPLDLIEGDLQVAFGGRLGHGDAGEERRSLAEGPVVGRERELHRPVLQDDIDALREVADLDLVW